MKKYKKTTSGKKGGLFVGKSHDDGGIPAIVVDTGQPIEVEGGEVIINKEASKKYWKELSEINQSAGNGVAIPPPMEFSKDVSAYKTGGKITISAIRQGTEMEMEHAQTIQAFKKDGLSVKEVARKIAKDHLKENPNYYKILTKLKLAKGGELICRSCGNSWLSESKVTTCVSCGSDNSKYYKTGGKTPTYSLPEKEQIYEQWKDLVNMSKSEIEKFYNSDEGKVAGLTKEKATELGIDNGRTSARWIMKMKGIPFINWTDEMWRWAKKQINFIKRMKGNKGSLYDNTGKKTRKHTSLLIWGHNPEKFKTGGQTKSKIPNKNKGGDCYYVAGTIAMNEKLPKLAKEFNLPNFVGTPYVVHAEVEGQGAISGLRYGHAWVEDDLYVYDFSNGREIVFPKYFYYEMGKVKTTKPKYFKYTFEQAVDKMLKTGHYGSWELITESGL